MKTTKLLLRRPSPAMIVALIALVAAGVGSASATTPSHGQQTATAKAAKKTKVKGNQELAGVELSASGTVVDWFNAFGGEPTVKHAATGVWDIDFPGAPALGGNSLLEVTGADPSCTVTSAGYLGAIEPVVETRDCNGTPADRSFFLTVLGDHNLS